MATRPSIEAIPRGKRVLVTTTIGIILGVLVGGGLVLHSRLTHYTRSEATVTRSYRHECSATRNSGNDKHCKPYETTVRTADGERTFRSSTQYTVNRTLTVWTTKNSVETTDPHGPFALLLDVGIGVVIAVVISALGWAPELAARRRRTGGPATPPGGGYPSARS